jgi:lipoprotein-anchoring transpeptidase ErfK/SrfK
MQTLNYMQQARIAIRSGRLAEARSLLHQHVRDDPQNYVAWLLLSRATPSPRAALEYVKQAEKIRPGSKLVQRELLRFSKKVPADAGSTQRPAWRIYFLLSTILVVLSLFIALLAPLGLDRVAALMDYEDKDQAAVPLVITPLSISSQVVVVVTDEPLLLPTPTRMPDPSPTPVTIKEVSTEESPAAIVEPEEGDVAQDTGTDILLEEATPAAEVMDNTVVETAEIVEAPVESYGLRPYGVGPAERWIDVNLNTQTLIAYEGDTPVFNSLISSGMWDTPTVTGQFRTNMKYESQDMNGYLLGYDYYLEDVPYVMYFFEDYAIHGAYWHNSFGTPMSHGCVNMNPVDAGWLYNWAPLGTSVNVHH